MICKRLADNKGIAEVDFSAISAKTRFDHCVPLFGEDVDLLGLLPMILQPVTDGLQGAIGQLNGKDRRHFSTGEHIHHQSEPKGVRRQDKTAYAIPVKTCAEESLGRLSQRGPQAQHLLRGQERLKGSRRLHCCRQCHPVLLIKCRPRCQSPHQPFAIAHK